MVPVSLRSDYIDCYDSWIHLPSIGNSIVFSRMAQHSQMSRIEMFEAFKKVGLKTPKFGKVVDFNPGDSIVLYEDLYCHCGEGKKLIQNLTADDYARYQHGWASEYVDDFPGLTYRCFVIAGIACWFKHISTEDWRSNCGDGFLDTLDPNDFLDVDLRRILKFKNPVYAIDFVVKRGEGCLIPLAIDFNTAPRLAGTPGREIFTQHFGSNQGIANAIIDEVRILEFGGEFNNNQILL